MDQRYLRDDGFDQLSVWGLPQDSSGWEEYNAFAAQRQAHVYPSPPESHIHAETPVMFSGIGEETPSPEPTPVPTTPDAEFYPQTVAVSTSFCPGSHKTKTDVVFSSTDNVLFYVDSELILNACPNAFFSFLPAPLSLAAGEIIGLPDTSVTLNIILHALYGTSCAPNSPTLDDLVAAVDRMPFYAIVPNKVVIQHSPLLRLLLSHAPLEPVKVYSLAGFHDIPFLAERTSSHLLAYPLPSITDALATRIGPVYLKRLFLLHVQRLAALKDILLQPPRPHAPTKPCSFDEQKKLTRAWALASAYLVWDARPDLSTHRIQSAFDTLIKGLSCAECKTSANDRIRDAVVQWAAIKCTI